MPGCDRVATESRDTVLLSAPLGILGPEGPRKNVAILIDHGRIRELGDLATLENQYPGLPRRRFPNYLGLPPVNAHTHLDVGVIPTYRGPFVGFIERMIQIGESRALETARKAATHLRQTLVGDIVARDAALVEWWLTESPFRGVVYWEVVGLLPPHREKDLIERTRARIRRWKALERPRGPRLGLSPHAPYTLTPTLMRALVEMAREEGLPLQIHAAESQAEYDYFQRRTGPLAEFLRSRGAPPDLHPVGLSPIAYLASLGVLEARPTLVHGVKVDEDDIRTLAQAGASVVSCPRSNINLQSGLPPYALYRKHGVTLALGTDSLGSAESLDVWDEISVLGAQGVDPEGVIGWAVLGGRRALGLEIPVLRPGMASESVVGC